MKKVREFCKLFMWAVIGGFIGKAFHVYFFYKKNACLLELMSAPWYAESLIPLIITAVIVVILIVIRVILKKKDKEQ